MNKKKKDLMILVALGILAIFLVILSFTLKDDKSESKNPSKEVDVVSPTEDDLVENVPNTDDVQGLPGQGSNTPPIIGGDEIPVDETEKADEFEELRKTITAGEKFTSENLRFSLVTPKEWGSHITVVEKDNYINFYFKKDHLFLTLSIIPESEWENEKEFAKTLVAGEGFRLVYAEALEHPLAGQPESEDYNLLTKIIQGNNALLKSVEFKK